MLKRLQCLATVVAGLALALTATPAAGQARPDTTCGGGFNLGALTLEQRLALPLVQAGLAAGAYTVESLEEVTAFLDKNENGLICVQVIEVRRERAAASSGWTYFANLVDDNAAVRP
jgi:hypothetical protein